MCNLHLIKIDYTIPVHVPVILKEPLILAVTVRGCVSVERGKEVVNVATVNKDFTKWRLDAFVSYVDWGDKGQAFKVT